MDQGKLWDHFRTKHAVAFDPGTPLFVTWCLNWKGKDVAPVQRALLRGGVPVQNASVIVHAERA